eukprot:XP_020397341.1 pentatricopeptide repeat-containing protein At5g08510 [Zea mays]
MASKPPCAVTLNLAARLSPPSSTLVSSYARAGLLAESRRVFDELPAGAAAARNAMLSSYARGGRVGDAERLFAGMPDQSVVSWTAMVSGYAQNGRHEEAVRTFLDMWDGAGVRPNELTVSSVLPACAALGALALGRKVERYARGRGMLRNVYVANALVEMYAKR